MGSSLGAQPLPPSCEGAGTQTIDGSKLLQCGGSKGRSIFILFLISRTQALLKCLRVGARAIGL